jgi:ABC-type Co2+ transport system permease subunit
VAVVVWWSVATVVLVLEGFQPVPAISRSFRLTQRQFSRNLAALVGGWALVYVPALGTAAQLASVFRKDGSASDVALLAPFSLAYVPVAPILAVLVVLTYLDRRTSNESVSFHPD